MINIDRGTTIILILAFTIIILQGCVSCHKARLLTDQQQSELIELLQVNGVDAEFRCNTAYVKGFYAAQGFILRVKQFRGMPEAEIGEIKTTISPIIQKYIQERNLEYKFVEVEVGNPPSISVDLPRFYIDVPQKSNSDTMSQVVKTDTYPLVNNFKQFGISFDYPSEWRNLEQNSFDQMQRMLKSNGVELLVLLRSNDDAQTLMIGRTLNSSSFDYFFEQKKEVARQVTTKGLEILNKHYTRYDVDTVSLNQSMRAVFGNAEKENGETGISYQFLSRGYEYDINFIYRNKTDAEKYKNLREQVMKTFMFIQNEK